MIEDNANLDRQLTQAVERAEKAALSAEKAARKAKKAAKKVKRAKLKVKASKKRMIALEKSSNDNSLALRDEIIEIAEKAAKKNKALKKIAKMNQNKNL